MRSIFPTSLILLTCIPSTFGQLSLLFTPRQTPGCQYPSLSDGTYIYFSTPNEPTIDFSIYTGWNRYYPDTLRAALAESGFKLEKQPADSKSTLCGWTTVDTVRVSGWHRGDIAFKDIAGGIAQPSEPEPVSAPKNYSIRLPRQYLYPVSAEDQYPIQLVTRTVPQPHRRPGNETIRAVHDILANNAPDIDIAVVLLEVIVPIVCTLAFVGLLMMASYHLARALYPRPHNVEDDAALEFPHDIELVSINGKSVSSIGQVEQLDPFVDPRKPEVAKEKSDRRVDSPRSKVAGVRSSSMYSRSVDGVTLY